jgi:transposase InsO family protein
LVRAGCPSVADVRLEELHRAGLVGDERRAGPLIVLAFHTFVLPVPVPMVAPCATILKNRSRTDQGSQFTGTAFTGALVYNDITISMDGKGAWRDNVFVERLWRSVKYEEVYLRAYDSVCDARASIDRYSRRPHSSLGGMTPDQAYFTQLPLRLAA